MRVLHVAALLLLTFALCHAEEEMADEGTEEVSTTVVETTTLSLRNRLRPRLRLLTTAAPTSLSSDGEMQTQDGGGSTSAAPLSTSPSQTPKPKRPRNRNRNRKTTNAPALTSLPSEETDDIKSTPRTTSRPKSRSRNRNRNRSSSTTKAPSDSSTTRSSKRRGSGRKTTTVTQASDIVESTTTKPSRGRKTIPPRRSRPNSRQKTSTTPSPSSTTVTSQSKTTQRSRLRSGVNSRNGKNFAKTTMSTLPPTTVTTQLPTTTVRRTTPVRSTTLASTPLSSIAFVPLQAEQGGIRSIPKVQQLKENENIHHKPAFASDLFLNGGFEEEPVRGTERGWQGVPPKVVGPVTFGAGRRNFRPLPEEGVILDAQEKPADNRMSPNKENMKVGEKFIGVPLTVVDPVMSGGVGVDTQPIASHSDGAILEDMKRPSTLIKPTAAGVDSARLLPPQNEKLMPSSARPLVPFQPTLSRQDLLSSRLKTDGFNEENMEVVPEKDPSRFEEPLGVPPKPIGPLPIRPLPKKIQDDSQTDNLKSRFAPGERVFIPPEEQRAEVTTPRSTSVPARAHSLTLQQNTGSKDSSGIRFISRTEAPVRPNLVSGTSTAFEDRRTSGRLSNNEKSHDVKLAQRGSVTTPLPPRRYSDVNSVRQKSRVTESPATSNLGNEDVSGVAVKARPNNVTPFPLWIDPRLSADSEGSSLKDNRAPSRPVASKRVTIPFPFEEDEPQNGVKTRFTSRPQQQQQRVTFAPNPTKKVDITSSRGTTTVKPQQLTSSFRPRSFSAPPKSHNTASTTPQIPTTTLDDASGEDYSDEEEELEETVTFPPRRSTANLEILQTVARTKTTPSQFESRPSIPQREQSLSKAPSPQNSFVPQQLVPENIPRRANFQSPRAVGTSLPLEQDTEVSSSIPKASSVRAQSPQTHPRNLNTAMPKEMRHGKDMPMKADAMVTTSTPTEFLSTEDIEDDDTVAFEPTNFNRPMSEGKGMPSMGDRNSPSITSPLSPNDERLPEMPRAVQATTENTRNTQRNMGAKMDVPMSDSRSTLAAREPFSVPAQSRLLSLENEQSSMPARGRNSLPFEPSSQNGFQHSMEKAKSSTLSTSGLPSRQLNTDNIDRTTSMHTSMDMENVRQRTTMPSTMSPADVGVSRPARPGKMPMSKEMSAMKPQLEDEDPFKGHDFPDDDASPPQPSGHLITPSLTSNPHRLDGPSDLARTSQFFESPSFIIRKPVNQPPSRDQVQVVPEVPEDSMMVKNRPMLKSDTPTIMPKTNNQPMMKPESQDVMPKTKESSMVKPEAREDMPSLMPSVMPSIMPSVTPSDLVEKSSAHDTMTNMKDFPMSGFEESSKSMPAQQRPTVLEQDVTSPRSVMTEQNSKIVQSQPAAVTNANPEEGVEYEYYYDS